VVADMDSTNHTAFPYSWSFQKPATRGHTVRVQRKADLYACCVDKNIDVDSPAWGRGNSYPGETTAQFARAGESCEYEYIYKQDKEDWFVPDKLASYLLRLLLVNLRDYYIQNNMTNGKAPWTGCDITVDIAAEKISISFKYDA